MKQHFTHSLIILLLALTPSACSGGGTAPLLLSSVGTASFSIYVPPQSTTGLRPAYVSPNTRSIGIKVNGGAAVVTALAPGSSACTGAPSQGGVRATPVGGLQCTVNVSAPIGSDVFAVVLYASTDGTGPALASQQVTSTVSAGQTTPVALTLDGAVASVSISLANPSPTEGTAATIGVTVTAKDASGATIIGPGNYTQAITLANTDTSGATQLSTTTVAGPSTVVTLSYNGAHVSASISASLPGSAPVTAQLSSVASTHRLWVANNQGGNVLAFSGTGNIAPVATIGGISGGGPLCQAFDASGNMWIVSSAGSKTAGALNKVDAATLRGTGYMSTSTTVISGSNTQIVNAIGCAIDYQGDIWLANDDNFNDSLIAFSAGQLATAGGNLMPAAQIHPVPSPQCCVGSNGSMCNAVGLAIDSSTNNIWVSSLCTNAAEFNASDIYGVLQASPTPISLFSQQFGPNEIALDAQGNMWTSGGNSVTEFTAASLIGANNNISAAVTIAGPATLMNNPVGLAFDGQGDLAVAQQGSNAITIYSAASLLLGGNVAPMAVISGSNTGLSSPMDIVYR